MAFTWNLYTHEVNDYCYYDNFFSSDEINNIIKAGTSLKLKEAKVGNLEKGSVNRDVRTTSISWLESNECEWIYRRLTDLVLEANKKWFGFELDHIETLQFSVYDKGNFYKKHVDHMFAGNGLFPRKLSFVVQLSDPNKYSGGKTLLHTSHESFAIPQQKGCITLFPSYILHEVTEITKGQRISLVGWVRGPKFK